MKVQEMEEIVWYLLLEQHIIEITSEHLEGIASFQNYLGLFFKYDDINSFEILCFF